MFNVSSSRRIFTILCISALTLPSPARRADAENAGGPSTLVRPPWKHNLGFNRLRQFHVTAYGGPGHLIDGPRGIAVVKLRAKDAEGAGDDDEVTVLGVNAGAREIVYNPSLVELAFFGEAEWPGDGLADPVGIAADAGGLVFVGDRGKDQVVVLRMDATTRLRFERALTLGETGRPLRGPCGVAAEEGLVYVADSQNNRVVVVDTTGTFVTEYRHSTTPLEGPFGVGVIDGTSSNRQDDRFLVVTDRRGQRLSQISLVDGSVRAVDYAQATGLSGGFGFVAIDYSANTFVTDAGSGCVFKFDRTLELLARFECDGDDHDDLDRPYGIAIHRKLGQVFMAEETGVSYYWIGTDVTGLRASFEGPGPGELGVQFWLTERSLVSVDLETDSGNTVASLARDVPMEPGRIRRTYRLDGPDLPCGVAECTYRVTVRARATYSSTRHLEVQRSAPVR